MRALAGAGPGNGSEEQLTTARVNLTRWAAKVELAEAAGCCGAWGWCVIVRWWKGGSVLCPDVCPLKGENTLSVGGQTVGACGVYRKDNVDAAAAGGAPRPLCKAPTTILCSQHCMNMNERVPTRAA